MEIALVFNPSHIADTGVHRGARAYSSLHPDLSFRPLPSRNAWQIPISTLEGYDGLLALPDLVRTIDRQTILEKTCTWFGSDSETQFASVNVDNLAVGRIAAAHLRATGCKRYVYFHDLSNPCSPTRLQGFAAELSPEFQVTEYREGPRTQQHGWSHQHQKEDLAELLQRIEHPLGLFAYDDVHGERALDACLLAGLRVPEDVAIISTSMNPIFCQYTSPPMSTVVNSPYRQGFEGMRLIHERLLGITTDLFRPSEPEGVISRNSTRILHSEDPLVNRAMNWLTRTPMPSWSVDALTEALQCSRMTLLRHFRTSLNQTPKSVMMHMQIDAARQRIIDTEDSLLDIALDCGFADSAHFSRSYKTHAGQSPQWTRRSGSVS